MKERNYSGNRSDKKKQPRPMPSIAKREQADEVRSGDRIVVTIKRLGINGEGVGYYRRKAVFVEGGIPGEVIKAEVTRVENKYIAAAIGDREAFSTPG